MNSNESLALDLIEEYADDITIDLNEVDASEFYGFLHDALRGFLDKNAIAWVDNPNQDNITLQSSTGHTFHALNEDDSFEYKQGQGVTLFDIASKIVGWIKRGAVDNTVAFH